MLSAADSVLGQRATSVAAKAESSGARMKAIVWRGKNTVAYEEVARPVMTDARDVLLQVTASTICGSDLHLYDGALPTMQSGDILGHEFMGVVVEVGASVTKVRVGQRVVVAFDIACGDCAFCRREEYTACSATNPSKLQAQLYGQHTAALFGYSHLTGGVPGGQAEYVRVPYADVNCLPLPDTVPDEVALYLSDIIPTSYFGVHMAEVRSS